MANDYYDSTDKTVVSGEIAEAADLNTINTAIESACDLIEADIDDLTTNQGVYSAIAEKWAEEEEDVEVEAGKYSALHHATKASASASAASSSESTASSAASTASNAASTATTAANNASTSASNASDSEDAAAVSAAAALVSEGNASDSEDAAAASAVTAAAAATPVGSIIAFIGGYFGSGSNGAFTNVIGNDASTINTLLNSSGWYVCDGSALNLAGSSIFNGASRYLPNLTDDRFLMGDTAGGAIGGDSAMAHTHSMQGHTHTTDIVAFTSGATTITTSTMPAHTHSIATRQSQTGGTYVMSGFTNTSVTKATASAGSGGSHTHSINPPSTASGGPSVASTGAATVTENRPKFLSCFYIMRAI